jgi:hypothetical protein
MVSILKMKFSNPINGNNYEFIHRRIELGPNVAGATDWRISLKFNGSLPIGGPKFEDIFRIKINKENTIS